MLSHTLQERSCLDLSKNNRESVGLPMLVSSFCNENTTPNSRYFEFRGGFVLDVYELRFYAR